MISQSMRNIADAQRRAILRPHGTQAIDIGFYEPIDANKPINQTRWSVVLAKWNGRRWQHVRRIAGPLTFQQALDRRAAECQRRALPSVDSL